MRAPPGAPSTNWLRSRGGPLPLPRATQRATRVSILPPLSLSLSVCRGMLVSRQWLLARVLPLRASIASPFALGLGKPTRKAAASGRKGSTLNPREGEVVRARAGALFGAGEKTHRTYGVGCAGAARRSTRGPAHMAGSSGAPAPAVALEGDATVVDAQSVGRVVALIRNLVPDLSSSKHKGQAGRVAVVGGCREYTGAPFFSAFSALRLGADLAHVMCSRDAAPVIKSYSPELIVHPLLKESHELQLEDAAEREALVCKVVEEVSYWVSRMDALVVGPGLGRDPFMMDCISGIMARARAANIPMVIDADGLFLVNQKLELVQGYPLALLTPNVVELKRLQSSLADRSSGHDGAAISPDEDPVGALREMAARLGHVTLLLKGRADTITDGRRVLQVAAYGSPRRCGGQGDILAGSTAALFAWANQWRRSSPPPDVEADLNREVSSNPAMLAACAACIVVRHAAASTFETRKRSMVTGDIINQLGGSFEDLFPVGSWTSEPRL